MSIIFYPKKITSLVEVIGFLWPHNVFYPWHIMWDSCIKSWGLWVITADSKRGYTNYEIAQACFVEVFNLQWASGVTLKKRKQRPRSLTLSTKSKKRSTLRDDVTAKTLIWYDFFKNISEISPVTHLLDKYAAKYCNQHKTGSRPQFPWQETSANPRMPSNSSLLG